MMNKDRFLIIVSFYLYFGIYFGFLRSMSLAIEKSERSPQKNCWKLFKCVKGFYVAKPFVNEINAH